MKKYSFVRVYLITSVVLLVASLSFSEVEQYGSQTHIRCDHYFCSEPYKVDEITTSTTTGNGFPFVAIVTSETIIKNGHETKTTTPFVKWWAVVVDLIVVMGAALFVTAIVRWFLKYKSKQRKSERIDNAYVKRSSSSR